MRPGVPRTWIGSTPLHVASIQGEQDIVSLLIQHGADVNALGGDHQITPLHGAAASGHVDVAKDLVAAGADLKVRDTAVKATPEEWARRWGRYELANLLKPLPS
jgi:ankyrin repeat protein